MKSPWKFLVQLTSRARPAETREGSTGQNAETPAIESDRPQASVVPLKLTQAPDKSDQDENPPVDLVTSPSNEPGSDLDAPPVAALPVEVGEVEAPALDEFRQSSVEAPALAPLNATNKRPSRVPQTTRPAHAKKTATNVVSEKTAAANSGQSAQSSFSRESFFDEVARLDEEIRQLRSQLAQKLYLQNVQLIKMLERFNLS